MTHDKLIGASYFRLIHQIKSSLDISELTKSVIANGIITATVQIEPAFDAKKFSLTGVISNATRN